MIDVMYDSRGNIEELSAPGVAPCMVAKNRQALNDAVKFLCSVSAFPGDQYDVLAQRLGECEGLFAYLNLQDKEAGKMALHWKDVSLDMDVKLEEAEAEVEEIKFHQRLVLGSVLMLSAIVVFNYFWG